MLIRPSLLLGGLMMGSFLSAHAAAVEFCVSCKGPEQTYVCEVNAGNGGRNAAALRLHCVVNAARDRGHQSCTVPKVAADPCVGPRLQYVYSGDALPLPYPGNSATSSDASSESAGANTPSTDNQKDDNAKTLVDLTNRAVKSSKQRLQNAGETVSEATSKTRDSVKGAAKKTKSRVGEALRNARTAVGNAARTTFHCVRTLFGECW